MTKEDLRPIIEKIFTNYDVESDTDAEVIEDLWSDFEKITDDQEYEIILDYEGEMDEFVVYEIESDTDDIVLTFRIDRDFGTLQTSW